MSLSDESNFKASDLLWAEVRKSKKCEDTGVQIGECNGKVLVMRIQEGGLFQRWTPLQAGDQLLTVNDRNVDGMSADEVNRIFQNEKHIKVKAVRGQYGLSDSSSTNCSVEQSESTED
jgi:C-terminal processing protease CtpA/Prc